LATESIALSQRSSRLRLARLRGLAAAGLLAAGLALLGLGLAHSGSSVWLDVDGRRTHLRTHAATVGAVLRQAGVSLYTEDRISAGLETAPAAGQTIRVQRARPVVLSVDGRLWQVRTHVETVGQVLSEAGIALGTGDEIWLRRPGDGLDADCQARLAHAQPCGREVSPEASLRALAGQEPQTTADAAAPHVTVRRATAIVLTDAEYTTMLYSTAETVGQLVSERGIRLFVGDTITPALQSRIEPGTTVDIRRSVPVEIVADGHSIRTRTLAGTVAGVLAQERVALVGRDAVQPAMDSPVLAQMTIRVTRIREELEVEFENIPYQTVWTADPELELDTRQLVQNGQLGLTKRRYRIVYEDGRKVSRTLEDAWTEQQPVTKTLSYGTKIVIRTLDTRDGPIEYWRKMRAYTVSYTAASSGKAKTDPRYGYTRLGILATKGVAAVDPTVIPLRSRIYVPGYGRAIAADTGGGVKGKLVDLCFDVGKYESWHRWTDIYLLTPVPPRSQIRWLLPDWPKFPDRRR
jgi:uncharacterized protein YabE (DUF348 family)